MKITKAMRFNLRKIKQENIDKNSRVGSQFARCVFKMMWHSSMNISYLIVTNSY
jgi:hypothetical protein